MMLLALTREGVTTKPARDVVVGDIVRTGEGPARVHSVVHDRGEKSGQDCVLVGVSSLDETVGTGVAWLAHQDVDVLKQGAHGSIFEPLFSQVRVATSVDAGAPAYDPEAIWAGPNIVLLKTPPGAAEYHRQQGRRALQSELRALLNAERA